MTPTRIAFAFAVALVGLAAAGTSYKVERTMPIGGVGSWDYATLDESGDRLYLPRTAHTLVIDARTGKTLADIQGNVLTHGVALVPALNRGYITDGKKSCVTVFDLKTFAKLGDVPAAIDADGIIFDASSNHLFIACGDASALVVIAPDVDPVAGKPEATIPLGGKPEFLAADGAGRVFVNLNDTAEVAVVDTKSMKVVDRWSIAPGAKSTGMAIDREKGRLFIGGRNQHLIVMSTKDGSILADLPIGAGVDATTFRDGTAMASCADGTLWIVRETSPSKFEVVQTLKTAVGARTMAVDKSTGTVYLPCADVEAPPAGAPATRPKMVPGSFKVLVVTPG